MATYRDAALAEFDGRRTDWITRGREKLRPVMTDKTGKLVLDPLSKTTVAKEDQAEGLLILTTSDGSNVSFAVWPDKAQAVRVVQLVDGQWTMRAEVRDLDDVGEAIAKGQV